MRGKKHARLNASINRLGATDEIIEELVSIIHKEGRDPNIILRIDALEED